MVSADIARGPGRCGSALGGPALVLVRRMGGVVGRIAVPCTLATRLFGMGLREVAFVLRRLCQLFCCVLSRDSFLDGDVLELEWSFVLAIAHDRGVPRPGSDMTPLKGLIAIARTEAVGYAHRVRVFIPPGLGTATS